MSQGVDRANGVTPLWPAAPDDREGSEYLAGRWVEKPTVGHRASRIQARLIKLLGRYDPGEQAVVVLDAECGYQIFPHEPKRVRKPDVSVIRAGRLTGQEPDGHLRVVPDLIVEVISPNELADALAEKLGDYARAGVPLVWVINPTVRTARVLRREGGDARLGAGDELDGEGLMPGFRVKLAELIDGA